MASELRQKSINGMLWTTMERFATQGIQFLISILIARILLPSDYGIIGMLAIFMAIAQSFLDSGFGSALIQKKNRTETDYCTVFYFNVIVSLIIYLILFFIAPWIATFYELPILTDVVRVVSLSIIINGLSIVQTTKLTVDLAFRPQAIASIVSVLASGCVGIWMAYAGFGVWALVYQGLAGAMIRTSLLWVFSTWLPKWIFSFSSFREMFSFGSKLLCSGMINTIYQNIYSIVIGKAFGASDVGYFNRGKQFATIPTDTCISIIIKVNFPVLSSLQDDNERLLAAYKKLLRIPLFLLFPFLAGMATLAHPLVEVVLGERWLPCVPILQILCIGCMWSPMTHTNLNLLYVKGRSDLVLKLELIKKPIGFALLFLTLPFGILWMCIGRVLYFFIAFYLNCRYTQRMLQYGFLSQMSELLPILLYTITMCFVISIMLYMINSPIQQLLLGTLVGIISYGIIARINKDESFSEILEIIKLKFCK